jgi:hypothetical protein
MIALFIFQRCSEKNGAYRTLRRDVAHFGRLTSQIWMGDSDYKILAEWEDAEYAVDEFMEEREDIRVRSSSHFLIFFSGAFSSSLSTDIKSTQGNKRDVESSEASSSNHLSGSSDSSDVSYISDGDDAEEEEEEEEDSDFDDLRAASGSGLATNTPSSSASNIGNGPVRLPCLVSSHRLALSLSADFDTLLWPQTVNFPSSSTTFPSHEALFVDIVKAIVPKWGVSVNVREKTSTTPSFSCTRNHSYYRDQLGGRCPFIIRLKKASGRYSIDYTRSKLQHSHGVAPDLLRDPDWRPPIIRADARAALGLKPVATKKKDGKAKGRGRRKGEKEEEKERKASSSKEKFIKVGFLPFSPFPVFSPRSLQPSVLPTAS